ncbi:MAG: P-loop ATPase, Sll1717 family, partial [Acidimicrobiia bacterium]
MHATTGLSDLYFGRAAAENEVASDADRFVETYFDQWDLLSTFEGHNRFLILGPKGSGKSAAAHYIQLQWKRRFGDHAVFATYVDFDDLNRTQTPLASLDKKLVGDVPALTDSAWRLFLAVRLLDSLMRDNACAFGSDPQVLKLVGELRSSGLASDDFPQVLRRVREKRGSVGVPKLGQVQAKAVETSEVSVGQLGDALIELVIKAPTANRHLLAIDGLDKAIGDKPAYWQTLAALVRVADALTRRLREHNAVHVHLLVLCRSDVFRRVRFADAAKIAADGGIYTDWGAEAANPKDVRLWEYISRKARTPIDDLFEFFPTGVRVGEEGRVAIERYLLQVTRYTPRDMTLLFNTLSDFSGDGVLSNAQVRRGADTFASRHLLTEVMAEAHGLLPEPVVDRFEQVI